MEIKGAVAVVTGAGSGLGAATALRLGSLGATVVGVDRNRHTVEATIADLDRGIAVVADITDTEAVARVVEVALDAGPFRFVVNCAGDGSMPARTVNRKGVAPPMAPWRSIIELALVAAYDVTRQTAAAIATQPVLDDGGRGAILHTSSIAGLDGAQGVSGYASAKGALAPMVHSAARDLSIWGIRVLAIAPGPFSTPMYDIAPADFRARREAACVFPKRPGRPSEFAALAQHLIENDYLNADCFRIDAGMRMHD